LLGFLWGPIGVIAALGLAPNQIITTAPVTALTPPSR
jgi:hypothetical protein